MVHPQIFRAALICTSLGILFGVGSAFAAAPSASVDYNHDIRPLFGKYCLSCHGRDEDDREGGLRLDDRDSATGEADSGERAVVPGQADSSELIRRVTSSDDDERMPPAETGNRLTGGEIELLKRWIDDGARYAGHWSFIKPKRPVVPKVRDPGWAGNEIDFFILRRLDAAGLHPNPPADRYTLIRRLSLDLRGLPPTIDEVEQFVSDQRPDAYARLVDRMLSDTAYGERWARVWLDLARYADSRGYGSDPLRPNMWRYRDWVIDALNRDLPYDEFTVDQLAGDLLPNATLDQKMATAFHRNTMTNTEGGTDDEEFRVAAIKDRVDTTIQVWMGLTMGCAKCHSHKYDPITQEEYYQFFAIFNQTMDSDRPDEFPTMEAPREEDQAARKAYETKLSALEQQLADLRKKIAAAADQQPVRPVTGRFVRVEIPGKKRLLSLAEVQVFRGGQNVATEGKAKQSSTDYEGVAERAIDGNTAGDYFQANSTTHTRTEENPWWELDLGQDRPIDRIVVWNRMDGGLHTRLSNFNVQVLNDAHKVIWDTHVAAAPKPSLELTPRQMTPLEQQRVKLEQQIARHKKTRPQMPTLPVMQELAAGKRRETHVLAKGNFLSPGKLVTPAVLHSFNALPPGCEANRLGVARWLMDPDNPLTARVAVNRYWAQLFGTGLVATEEDFGTQGDPPSHPELLDWLATEFVRVDWDVKQLLREIVSSSTYRQSARVREDLLAKDPRNRLLGRGPRIRLDAETVRDQALALSGLLSRKIGGPSVYPYQPAGLWRAAFNGQRKWPTSKGEDRYRRAIYTFWRRTVPYPSLATFDAPSRELCTVRRVRTNTPLQALVTLNDPVYVEIAQALGRRLVREGGTTTRDRLAYGLRLCLCRPPAPAAVDVLDRLYQAEFKRYADDPEAARQMATDPLGPLPDGSSVEELAAWTVVANVLLNMDGVLNKQ